jgi:hypothetical protein
MLSQECVVLTFGVPEAGLVHDSVGTGLVAGAKGSCGWLASSAGMHHAVDCGDGYLASSKQHLFLQDLQHVVRLIVCSRSAAQS